MGERTEKVQYIPFSASDWLAGTATLSLPECGLYIRICALIYVAGRPITKADLRKAVPTVRYETFSSLLLSLIEKGKVTFADGLIDQPRCKRELAKARQRIASGAKHIDDSDREAVSTPIGSRLGVGFESAREPEVSCNNKEMEDPYARANPELKGETKKEVLDFKNLKGDLGRCAPSPADPPSAEDVAAVEAAVTRATAALRGVVPKGIRDPVAYDSAVKSSKFRRLVGKVNTWAGTALDGDARLAAWEVAALAETAGSRAGMLPETRTHFDRLVEMYRASDQSAEMAEAAD